MAAPRFPRHWSPPPPQLALPPGHVHVWRASLELSDSQCEQYRSHLTEDEQARARRFRLPLLATRFIAARGILRGILAGYLQLAPHVIQLAYSGQGKPSLDAGRHGDGLRFNLSHSGNLALFAFRRDGELGIDLEEVRTFANADAIARRYFAAAEVAAYEEVGPSRRRDAFFDLWTLKEAYLKAQGQGLAIPLDAFAIVPRPDRADLLAVASADRRDDARWSLLRMDPGPGFVGALALEGTDWELAAWQWET